MTKAINYNRLKIDYNDTIFKQKILIFSIIINYFQLIFKKFYR